MRALRKNRFSDERRVLTLPEGIVVDGLKPFEAYNEYKDIFRKGIYRFESSQSAPVIIDGGGYVGFSTLYFKHLYPKSQVTVFECDPEILKVLKKNLEQNHCDGVRVVEAALSGADGEATFFRSGDDAGSLHQGSGESFKVQCQSLKPYLEAEQEVDFLKLNIEGAEMDVLKDCGESLKNVRELVIEFHSFAGQAQGLQDLLACLSEQGFRYLLNDFDADSNWACMTPFRCTAETEFVLLVYAKREDLL